MSAAEVAEILAEEEREAARHMKAAEAPLQGRLYALEARLNCLEAAPRGSGFYPESFWGELAREVKDCITRTVKPLEARIKELEARPQMKYLGVHRPGATYSEGLFVTADGSVFVAKKLTSELPDNGCQDWQLAVKRGRDAKDCSK